MQFNDIIKLIVQHLGYHGVVDKLPIKVINHGNGKDVFEQILDKIAFEILNKYGRRSNYILMSLKFKLEYFPAECMIASHIEGECIDMLKAHNMISYKDVDSSDPLNENNENDKNAGNK